MPQWTPKHERAAFLIAEGMLTIREIAQTVKLSERTVEHWKSGNRSRANDFLEFPARVRSLREELLTVARAQGIALAEQRIKRANDDWQRLQMVRRQRAEDPAMRKVPGGSTGLVLCTTKSVGRGDAAQLVDEYEIDHGLLAELRALETQVARELSQLNERAGKGGRFEFLVRYVDCPDYASLPPPRPEED